MRCKVLGMGSGRDAARRMVGFCGDVSIGGQCGDGVLVISVMVDDAEPCIGGGDGRGDGDGDDGCMEDGV